MVTKWTILTYIASHNNLEELGQESLQQIAAVGSSPEVIHGVLVDSSMGADRILVGKPGKLKQAEHLAQFDSGDPDRLIETAAWLFRQHPAERYGLILWSHGTGWRPEEIERIGIESHGAGHMTAGAAKRVAGLSNPVLFRSTIAKMLASTKPSERAVLFDDGTGHSLDMVELERVATRIGEMLGQPLELLGMDACLMASLEVAYQVRRSVRYYVASAELVPGHSWPYGLIFGDLAEHPDWTGADLGRAVVRHYTDFYRAHPPRAGDVTKVALDLAGVDTLAVAVGRLAAALAADIAGQAPAVWQAQTAARRQETREGGRGLSKFDYHLWDIGSVARRLAGSSSAPVAAASQAVLTALRPGGPAVLAEGHVGDWFDGIGGVSFYLMPPGGGNRLSPYYDQVAFAQPPLRWLDFLRAYHAHYA
ncbi:MAG: clostripain-related cysteine peptidase [Anaerolineae bacterium]